MTGFAEESYHGKDMQLTVSLRSVNGRYLDVRPHLPKEYFSLEAEIKKHIQSQITRSTVDLYVSRKIFPGKKSVKTVFNETLAHDLYKGFDQIRKKLKIKDSVSMNHLLKWPEVVSLEMDSSLVDGESKIFFELLEKVLKKCNHERAREGDFLFKDIKKHLTELSNLCTKMEPYSQANQELVRQNLQQRLTKLKNTENIDESRIAQEVVLFLDRSDVSEELSRLREHIAACLGALKSETILGKKLEFFCQELLREVNTLGSKSQKPDLTHLVVEAKGCIERLREQVQNIE